MTTQPAPTLSGIDIAMAQQATRALLDELLAAEGIWFQEWAVLRLLTVGGPTDEAAARVRLEEVGLEPSSFTRLFAALRSKGWLAAGASAPLTLTDEGAAVHARANASVSNAVRELYSAFDPEDLATAQRVLAGVTQRANSLRAR